MRIRAGLGVLRERNFALLYAGRTVSLIGDGMTPVALAFAVLELTGSTADLGIVLAARSLMVVVCILAGGVWADRISPRVAMIVADLSRIAVMGTMGALLVAGTAQVWQLAGLYALEGLGTALFNPASSAIVPAVVPTSRLQDANALIGLSKSVGQVAGPAFAGVLLALGSPGDALLVDAATFAVSAAFLLRIAARPVGPAPGSSFVEDLREGWTEFSSRTWLWVCVAAAAASNAIFFPAFQVLGPTVAQDSLGGSGSWALIAAAFGLGSVAGGIAAITIRVARILLFAEAAVLALIVPMLLLASGAGTAAVAPGAFVAGFGLSVAGVLYETAIQQHVPTGALARVSAYDWFGSLAIEPLGFALVGALAAGVGISPVLWAGAALLLLTQSAVLAVPSVRGLRSTTSVDFASALEAPIGPGD
ncbi:MAG: MFS transporter [Actinobacteria bacterium]|nr:MFS transporter [Actinomycetota bacterium]